MGESDGPGVVGDNVGNFIGANSLGLDFAELELGFGIFDLDEGESTLDIIEDAVALVCLDDGEGIHNSNGEFAISSDFVVDLESSFLVHCDEGDFT